MSQDSSETSPRQEDQVQQPRGAHSQGSKETPGSGAEPEKWTDQDRAKELALDRTEEDPKDKAQDKSGLMEVAGLQKVQPQSDEGIKQTDSPQNETVRRLRA